MRPVLVHVDDPRLRIGRVEQSLTKEALGCRGVALGREQEINGLSGGIRGSVQVSVLPFYSASSGEFVGDLAGFSGSID
jgi:hypothetical protein